MSEITASDGETLTMRLMVEVEVTANLHGWADTYGMEDTTEAEADARSYLPDLLHESINGIVSVDRIFRFHARMHRVI